MHAVFLYHAIHAGLDMGIVNAGMLAVYAEIEPRLKELVEDVILNRRPDATERLVAFGRQPQDGRPRSRRRRRRNGGSFPSRNGSARADQGHRRLIEATPRRHATSIPRRWKLSKAR